VILVADEFCAPREFIEHAGIRCARARCKFHDEFHRRGMQFSVSRCASPILENIDDDDDDDDDDGDDLFRSRACEHRNIAATFDWISNVNTLSNTAYRYTVAIC